MKICVTHVDSKTKIACDKAPMAHGPAYPEVDGLSVEFSNSTAWPTDKPLFYGICADTANTNLDGVVKVLTDEEYEAARFHENDMKSWQVRQQRDKLLVENVDSMNILRWNELTAEQQAAVGTYRQELLNVPQQAGFPWTVVWPTFPL